MSSPLLLLPCTARVHSSGSLPPCAVLACVKDPGGNIVYHAEDAPKQHQSENLNEDRDEDVAVSSKWFVYSDLNSLPARWRVNNQVHYCFETTGAHAISLDTAKAMRVAISQAQQEINAMGECIVFIERASCDLDIETLWIGKYDETKCWSSSGSPAKINLGWCDSMTYKGSMIHELGHALGLAHEQCRPDRDKFLTINTGNIPNDWKSQYDKRAMPSNLFELVVIASGYACPTTAEVIAGDDPDTCVKNLRAAGSTCSVIQFKASTLACSCCDDVVSATVDADVQLYQVHIGGNGVPPPAPPAEPSPPPFPPGEKPSIFFDFSKPLSIWSIGPYQALPWTRRKRGTPSEYTGPIEGPNGPDSWYFYVEASGRSNGDVFNLHYDGSGCPHGLSAVDFSYSMYGTTIGILSVVGDSEVWVRNGNQGPEWHSATRVQLDNASTFAFRYVRGRAYSAISTSVSTFTSALAPSPTNSVNQLRFLSAKAWLVDWPIRGTWHLPDDSAKWKHPKHRQ
ncbi:MAG: hypothetical protein SGPRY_009704 [Prymnesium sp.]